MKLNKLFVISLSSALLVSVASAKKPKKSFEELDTDGDSKVSLAEFVAGGKDETKATEHFQKIDVDQDGFLTKEELSKGAKGRKKPRKEKEGK